MALKIAPWPGSGNGPAEYAVAFDRGRPARVLIAPALFDEANRMRRLVVETMRRLDTAGIDSIMPDLPGTNESLAPHDQQSLTAWAEALGAVARHFAATHVLAIRGGALIAPALPGWSYAGVNGTSLLRQMMRMRILAAREAGRDETQDQLLALGRLNGIDLGGYRLAPTMLDSLLTAQPLAGLAPIAQSEIGGPGLWLRAEPGDDPRQSAALADRLTAELLG